MNLPEELTTLIQQFEDEQSLISDARKETLKALSSAIQSDLQAHGKAQVTFVCTHNSRRSQLGQVLLKVLAHHYDIEGINTFSGGTEATTFNHRMVAALQRAGFLIEKTSDSSNPNYEFKVTASEEQGDRLFSKVYYDTFNPQKNFIAVMVCSEADEGCPFVVGASSRISLPYQDPKNFDDTPEESSAYTNKIVEIGRELTFVVKQLVD